LTKFSSGWIGLGVGLSTGEIDALIARLLAIRNDPAKHFHVRSNHEPGVGDIEFYVKQPDGVDNMTLE
jgi:hypothetical protein